MTVRRVVGIDVGTSAVKVSVYDDEQGYARGRSRSYPIERPAAGHAEQDPSLWWAAVHEAVEAVVGRFHPRPADNVVVGFTGQMHTHVWVDGDGAALTPGVLWFDTRAGAQRAELVAAVPNIESIIGGPLLPNATAPLLKWDLAQADASRLSGQTPMITKDLIRRWATGGLHTDPSDGSSSAMMDHRTLDWSPEILAAVGLTPAQLAPIVPASTVVGDVSALEPLNGAAAVVGLGDVPSQAYSMGLGGNIVGVSLGTSAVAMSVGAHQRGAFPLVNDDWVGLDSVHGCSASIDWATDLIGVSRMSFSNLASASPPGANGLLYLPFIEGQRATEHPVPAGLIGIGMHHSSEDIARAVLEGIAFELKRLMDSLTGAAKADQLQMVGGLAADPTWRAIFAAVFGCPNLLSHDEPADGAALLAARSMDAEHLITTVREGATNRQSLVEPDPSQASVYQEAFERYCNTVQQLSHTPTT